MKKTITFYALHCCLCAGFILIPYVFSSTGNLFHMPNLSMNGHDRTYFAIYFALLVFLYANYYILIPKFYFHNKRILYFAIILASMVFFLWISNIFDRPFREISARQQIPVLPYPGFDPAHFPIHPGNSKPTQYEHTILVFIIGIVSSLFLSINKRLQLTESEKIQAELSLLKAQINPHFLFNTLNSIYSLAIRKDDKTADSIVQLSELMRYIMNNANDNVIDLAKEINYINNYISLQKARLENTVKINYMVRGNAIGKQITPLILISFIENAFKHGVNPEENSEIDILIDMDDDQLKLLVYNKKVRSIQAESGIGMKNTRDRLELLYPEKHQVEIVENGESYSIKLTIKL